MPDRSVTTIQELIFYQYVKIIAKRAFASQDGKEAKKKHYGFIKNRLKGFKNGQIAWSDIEREDWQLVESDKECIYCGATEKIQREHIVPKSLAIKPECASCDTIQGIHNQIWACADCNLSKGQKGLYEFYKAKLSNEKKFYDVIPPLAEKKYLKTILQCHGCANTLDRGDIDGDGKLTVLDIDGVIG